MPSRCTIAFTCLAAFLAFAQPSRALINPKFTPVDLVRESEHIWELKLSPIVDNMIEAKVTRTLKGKNDTAAIMLDLSQPQAREHAEAFAVALKQRGDSAAPCLFFAGRGAGNEADGPMGYMHLDGIWIAFMPRNDGKWRMTVYNDEHLPGTWRGGTDMLLRAVEYVLAEPEAEFPSDDGAAWVDPLQFARIEDRINGCMGVDLAEDGTSCLFVACDNGDRFFAYDPVLKNLKDVTSFHATASKSKVFAWGNFNSDGRLDLISADGANVVVYKQTADGKFVAGAKLPAEIIKGRVVSLAVLATGMGNATGILVGTESQMLLWTGQDGAAAPRVISDGSLAKDLGKAGRCLVADFDGVGAADILQCFEKGAILCRGQAIGKFAAPRMIDLAAGDGRCEAFVGDFAADGRLDIVTLSDDACKMWQNQGHWKFTETLNLSGEVGYKAAGGAVAGTTCDFNNDGRQDIVLFYGTAMSPQLFFNRGFRSFGFANHLAEGMERTLPRDAAGRPQGQQAGCVANFTGNATQDMVVILNNGQCWLFPIASGGDALALRVALGHKSSYAGPLTVTGWRDKRCLGAWNVIPGCAEAFIGIKDAGTITITWQPPGTKPQIRTFSLTDKVRRYVLAPEPSSRE